MKQMDTFLVSDQEEDGAVISHVINMMVEILHLV